ncbi:MAG: hypothetical protein KDD82_08030 [Planctomycetes bacterium]|nr:hypothetical protein [Planctomycetota bacterium]
MNHTKLTLGFVVLFALLGANPSSAQTSTKVSDQELVEVLTGKGADLPSMFRALADLRPSYSVSGTQLRRVLAGAGVSLSGFVGELLDGCTGLQVAGRSVSVSYAAARRIRMTDEHGTALGYCHLGSSIRAEVRDDGRVLGSIRGLKVSKEPSSFRVDLKEVRVSQSSITVKAGKLGVTLIKHTFDLSLATGGVAGALQK